MAHEKQYTAKQAAFAVLEKVGELLQKSELAKKYEGFKAVEESARKSGASDPAAVAAAIGRKKYGKQAFQEAAAHGHKMGKSEDGKIHPKEKEQAPSDDVRSQVAPQQNPKEQAEGNNMLAGTTPTQVGPDQKNLPGFDEMKGHIKLAKFLGHMEHKRISKKAVL